MWARLTGVNDASAPTTPGDLAHAAGFPIVTVIGDGQLARMMQTAATELGLTIRLLASTYANSAAQVTPDVQLGDYTVLDDVLAVAQGADAVTFDHEHVPNEFLDTLIAAGTNVQPQPAALVHAQDKLIQRQAMARLGLPVPAFAPVTTVAEALAFAEAHGQPTGSSRIALCVKATRGGYDGHGVWFPGTRSELEQLVAQLLEAGTPLMVEEKVDLMRELSILGARNPAGEFAHWAITETVQTDGICVEAAAPAPGLSNEHIAEIEHIGKTVMGELQVTGVLAVELFQTSSGDILINELAMRPHNTGHWTQDGAVTSQFEQHLRAVLNWPLGSTAMTAPACAMANVLGAPADPDLSVAERMAAVWAKYPQAKIHFYGKEYRAGRKLGHVTLAGEDYATVRAEARDAAHMLAHGEWALRS